MKKLFAAMLLLLGAKIASANPGDVNTINTISPQNYPNSFQYITRSTYVFVSTTPFTKNLGPTDLTVQHALQTLDQISIGSGTPGGSNTNVQINHPNGTFYGDNGFQYDQSVSSITTGGAIQANDNSTSFKYDDSGLFGNVGQGDPEITLNDSNGMPGQSIRFVDNNKLSAFWSDGTSDFSIGVATANNVTAVTRIDIPRGNDVVQIFDPHANSKIIFDPINSSTFSTPVYISTLTINNKTTLPYLKNSILGTDANGVIISTTIVSSGGGSSASPLAVGTGTATSFTTQTSSPTSNLGFNGAQFSALGSGTTTMVSLNQSSVTLQGTFVAGSNITLTPSGGVTTIAASGGGGSPGGSSGNIQYNNSGSFGGFGNWNGTGLTVASETVSNIISASTVNYIAIATDTIFSASTVFGNALIGENSWILNNNSGSGYILTSNTGATIFGGSEAFLGWADRTLGFQNQVNGWGWYASGGAMFLFDEAIGNNIMAVNAATANFSIGTVAPLSTAELLVTPQSSTQIGQVIQGAASQSGDLQDWDNSSSVILSSISSSGGATFPSITDTGLSGGAALGCVGYTSTDLFVSTTCGTGSGGGSSASPLAVGTGTASNFTTSITSPTAAISYEGAQFESAALGTTNYISLNKSSVTLQGTFVAGANMALATVGGVTTISASTASAVGLYINNQNYTQLGSTASPSFLAVGSTSTFFGEVQERGRVRMYSDIVNNALSAGTSGQALTSQGSGNAWVWQTPVTLASTQTWTGINTFATNAGGIQVAFTGNGLVDFNGSTVRIRDSVASGGSVGQALGSDGTEMKYFSVPQLTSTQTWTGINTFATNAGGIQVAFTGNGLVDFNGSTVRIRDSLASGGATNYALASNGSAMVYIPVLNTSSTQTVSGEYNFSNMRPSTFTSLSVVSSSNTSIPLNVFGASNQLGDLTEWKNSSGVAVASVTANGSAVFNNLSLGGTITSNLFATSSSQSNLYEQTLIRDNNVASTNTASLGIIGTTSPGSSEYYLRQSFSHQNTASVTRGMSFGLRDKDGEDPYFFIANLDTQTGFAPNDLFHIDVSSFSANAGNVGIGISTPTAKLSVVGFINTATDTAHPVPNLISCGTSPSLSAGATDTTGTITVGSGVVTSCTLTFGTTKGKAPSCTILSNSAITGAAGATTTSTFIISAGATFASDVVMYNCFGNE